MKPSFALNIADDAIGLLHRTSRGWIEVGVVPLDEPDLGQAIAYLRGSALVLEPRGITTKVVLPNSQVRYLTLTAPGPDAASRRAQIRTELEGKTPYAVDELAFDWWGKGPKVQVAVVARETLAEAEAFARDNRLNPVSFVAIPEPGGFGAEPWFGPSDMAASLLAPGEKVERDQDPIQIIARAAPRAAEPATEAGPETAPAPEVAAVEAGAAEAHPEEAVAAGDAGSADAIPVDSVPVEAPSAQAASLAPDEAPTTIPGPQGPSAGSPALTAPEDVPQTVPPAPGKPARADVTASVIAAEEPETPDRTVFVAAERASDLPPAPLVGNRGGSADPRPSGEDRAARNSAPPPPQRPAQKTPGRPPEAGSGPRPATPPGPRLAAIRLGPKIPAAEWPLESVTLAARNAGGKAEATARSAQVVTAPVIPMPRDRKLTIVPPAEPAEQPPIARPARSGRTEAEEMTVFGARKPRQRGKPRYLGLILTLILLAMLAAVAAWSSLYIARGTVETAPAVAETAPPAETTPALAEAEPILAPDPAVAPAPEDEMLADLQDPAEFADTAIEGTETAQAPAAELPAPGSVDTDAGQAASETALPPAEPAVELATVSQPDVAGVASRNPVEEPQDEIFLARVDPAVQISDAVSLATPAAGADPPLAAQPEPPPFGTVYRFDAEGRIIPTPEGIVTPEGVRLVAGPPPLVPPPRPAAPDAATPEVAAGTGSLVALPTDGPVAAEATFADPSLAGARPRARPEGIAPVLTPAPADGTVTDDDAALTIAENDRFSSLRPRARPAEAFAANNAALAEESAAVQAAGASLVASADLGTSASPLAVSVSRKPAPRPANVNRAIEEAVTVAAAEASLVPDAPLLEPEPPPKAAAAPESNSDDPEVVEQDEPEVTSAAPTTPSRSTVAKQATFRNAIDLSRTNLIGVYGTPSNRYAMVRQANGRFVKVEVGDRIDGGRVAAISDRELSYVKNGQTLTLSMPRG